MITTKSIGYKIVLFIALTLVSVDILAQKITYHYNSVGQRISHEITTLQAQIGVNPDELLLEKNKGQSFITMLNLGELPLNWTIHSNDDWLNLSGITSGTNDGEVPFSYSANTGGIRSGSFTITAPGAINSPYTYYVSQKGTNNPPIVKLPIGYISRYYGFKEQSFDLESVFFDPDGDVLTYTSILSTDQTITTTVRNNILELKETGNGEGEVTQIYVTASDGEFSVTDTLTFDYVSSLIQNELDEIRIYPNPSNGKFYLEFNGYSSDDYRLNIYSLAGKLQKNQIIKQGIQDYILDLNGFSSGAYILEISMDKAVISKTLIIRH